MSYPYQGNPGYGAPPGGYGPPQPGYPQQGAPQPGFPQQGGYGQVSMPTVESASAAAYGTSSGGYPGQPGWWTSPSSWLWTTPPVASYGAPQPPQPAMPSSYGPPQPQYQPKPVPRQISNGVPKQISNGVAPKQTSKTDPSSKVNGETPPPPLPPRKKITEGTLKPAKNFNAENDANILRKAMKGFGTDEKAIIDVLAFRSSEQRQQIRTMFKTMFGKDLIKELKSELGGKFEDCVVALMMPWDEFDAYELKRAMKGVGTDEDAMIEILCSRTNKQIQEIIATYLRTKDIQEIIATYKRLYSKKLEDDIISDTSGHFKRLMVSMASGGRMENQTVDPTKAQQDAQRLLQAGEKKLGTDESTFNAIMASQSYEQLRAVFDAYHKMAGKDIESSIKSEMSGNLEIGMLAIVRVVKNRPAYFAQKLYHSMKGLGTDDRTLIRIVVTRAEVDMVQIKQEFQRLYGKSLDTFIREDTSGDYKKVLMALVAQGGY
ncbi:annexin A7/11 [Mytilus galloprovincialis]|uniref:Annexin n=1 Tax=Mytilus galloprovincialis TaxID=29158 RepID=A0A8B6CAA6_MYTGA|nr:annexin A7/11 [Mytilus galloprovincialis]